MAEETATPVATEQKQDNGTVTIQTSPFGGNAWSETPPEPKKEEPKVESTPAVAAPATSTPAATQTQEEEEILDPKDWLKREFEVDDPQIIKQYLKEYKELKEKPAEYTFANDDSKRMAEAIAKGDRKAILKILETQDRLETFTTAEVTKDTADDIIKLGMQLKYKDLTPQEINYKFNKEFALPKEPVQQVDEDTDVFEARKAEWQEKVRDIEMTKIIEAKLAKPELEKLKSQIVLPEIPKPAEANQPTPEELENQKKWAERFVQTIDSNYTKAEGFSTKVKDESVELPVSFKIPEEERVAIKESFKKGFDIGEYMDKRWFDENDVPKADQMIYDRYVLENLDKILSGIANNAANDRLIEYKKSIKNIDLNGKTHQETFDPQQNGKKVSPFAKDAWSEQMPIRSN